MARLKAAPALSITTTSLTCRLRPDVEKFAAPVLATVRRLVAPKVHRRAREASDGHALAGTRGRGVHLNEAAFQVAVQGALEGTKDDAA